jgi:phosphoribosylformylglycinamidine cyclo-ligase
VADLALRDAEPASEPVRSAYADAGVDVQAGDRAVELMRRSGAIAGSDLLGALGGFGAAIPIPVGFHEPVLVSATDGVGTKIELARRLDRLDGVGRDLVAMCADDVACHGAQPFIFLDYLAIGRVVPERVARIVDGVAAGCRDAGCELVGGETAEHPGVMRDDEFDLAGFCVGIVERARLIDNGAAAVGDAIVGIASSGLHSNGFSLVRRVVDANCLDLEAPHPRLGSERTLGEVLLEPTRIYARPVLALRDELEARNLRLAGIAHVTGGGLPGNLPRAVPSDLGVAIDPHSWTQPPVFGLIGDLAGLGPTELRSIFNCGIGMAMVVEPAAVPTTIDFLAAQGMDSWEIGEVVTAAAAGPTRYLETGE